MIQSRGLAHIHLKVADLERSARFYETLGYERVATKHAGTQLFMSTPEGDDLLTLSQGANPGEVDDSSEHVGENGGIDHFGFKLADQASVPDAVDELVAAGATLIEMRDLAPGWPTAFLRDPDGYAFQL